MTILDLLDSCDKEFKEKFIKNAFDFIKEEKIYKIKHSFISEYADLIAQIRNTELVMNHGSIPGYSLWDEYNIVKEFGKKQIYPDEVEWLMNYRNIVIPYSEFNNYDSDSYDSYEETGYDSDSYDSYEETGYYSY